MRIDESDAGVDRPQPDDSLLNVLALIYHKI